MKKIMLRTATLGLSFLGSFALLVTMVEAQKLDVDWKYFGETSVDGGTYCFYEAKSIVDSSDGYRQVWTKCLLKIYMESIDKRVDKSTNDVIINFAAKKISNYYMPPIGNIIDLDLDAASGITTLESIADNAYLPPHDRLLYELNCRERTNRYLSMYLTADGKSDLSETPSQWIHIGPEGKSATLFKLLCTPGMVLE